MPAQINSGDIVQLRSGGPLMVVGEQSGNHAVVYYFDSRSVLQVVRISIAVIVPVTPQ